MRQQQRRYCVVLKGCTSNSEGVKLFLQKSKRLNRYDSDRALRSNSRLVAIERPAGIHSEERRGTQIIARHPWRFLCRPWVTSFDLVIFLTSNIRGRQWNSTVMNSILCLSCPFAESTIILYLATNTSCILLLRFLSKHCSVFSVQHQGNNRNMFLLNTVCTIPESNERLEKNAFDWKKGTLKKRLRLPVL